MTQFAKRIVRAVGIGLLVACATAAAVAQERSAAEQKLAGTWIGEFAPNATSPVQRFLTTRREDGTFSVQARLYQGGKMVAETRNSGLWGISNGMYFTVTTEVNGKPSDAKLPEAVNAYLVKGVAADRFDYVHVQSGGQFTVTKIDPSRAKLPD